MKKLKFWKKVHRFQEKAGWCGPAVVQTVLLSAGITKTQKEIAKDIYQKWWGTGQNIMLAYLSQFFRLVNFRINAKISDIAYHLKKGHIVVVNWWDDLDAGDPDGHYTIVANYSGKSLTMVDSSTSRDGVWKMKAKEFKDRWYDYLDVHANTWVDGWMLWVDPASKVSK
jgi:hypothetical protein